jgi:hypothetical protein
MTNAINNFGKNTLTPPPPTTSVTPPPGSNNPGGSTGSNTVRVSKYVDKGTCPSGEAYYDDYYVDGQLISSTFVACVVNTNIVGTPVGDGQTTITTANGNTISGQPSTFTVGGATIISGYGGTPLTANPNDNPNEAAARQDIADIFATIGDFGAGGYNVNNVTVNVGGSVMTGQDLTQMVLDGLYEYQKRGQVITVSAVGL